MCDLLRYLLLLVGEEAIGIALARHVVLALQTDKGLLDAVLEGALVHVEAVYHEDGDVLDRGLDVADVTNQVQELEHLNVVGFKALCVLGRADRAIDHLDDAVLKVFGDSVEEAPERHECTGLVMLDGLSALLERAQHGALACGHVFSLDTVFAHLGHHVGQELKLIAHKRVAGHKILGVGVAGKVGARATLKGKVVFEHGGVLLVDPCKHIGRRRGLLEHTALDDLVHAGAGERKAGIETALDL